MSELERVLAELESHEARWSRSMVQNILCDNAARLLREMARDFDDWTECAPHAFGCPATDPPALDGSVMPCTCGLDAARERWKLPHSWAEGACQEHRPARRASGTSKDDAVMSSTKGSGQMENNRVRMVEISPSMLVRTLFSRVWSRGTVNLERDGKIVRIENAEYERSFYDSKRDTWFIVISHESFSEVERGAVIPMIGAEVELACSVRWTTDLPGVSGHYWLRKIGSSHMCVGRVYVPQFSPLSNKDLDWDATHWTVPERGSMTHRGLVMDGWEIGPFVEDPR